MFRYWFASRRDISLNLSSIHVLHVTLLTSLIIFNFTSVRPDSISFISFTNQNPLSHLDLPHLVVLSYYIIIQPYSGNNNVGVPLDKT